MRGTRVALPAAMNPACFRISRVKSRDYFLATSVALVIGCSTGPTPANTSNDDGGAAEPASATADGGGTKSWRNCNGSEEPRACAALDLQDFDAARKCFQSDAVHVAAFCFVCTIETASASIGPVCGVDARGRLFVITTRPDLRLEAPGWRFGHRRDRGVYRDLEPEGLTTDESSKCDLAIATLQGGFDTRSHSCAGASAGDGGAD